MPDRPAWAQGPEWEAWLEVPGEGLVYHYGYGKAIMIRKGEKYVVWVEARNCSISMKIRKSPDALRIYAEGLLRLEAELEASE
jgi:hypothetical protein